VPGFVDAHGHNLGPGQRLTSMEGLHAMTIWPAYQHFEEAAKGSIEPGKKAVGRKSTQSATWEAHLLLPRSGHQLARNTRRTGLLGLNRSLRPLAVMLLSAELSFFTLKNVRKPVKKVITAHLELCAQTELDEAVSRSIVGIGTDKRHRPF